MSDKGRVLLSIEGGVPYIHCATVPLEAYVIDYDDVDVGVPLENFKCAQDISLVSEETFESNLKELLTSE